MLERQRRPSPAHQPPPAQTWTAPDKTPRFDYDNSGERIIAQGVLDFASTELLTEILDAALARHLPSITLDVTDVRLLDAATIGVLVTFHRRADGTGCVFRVIGATRLVRRVLEVTGTLPLLTGL
jgi:anti-anti-sigma factor